MRLSPTDRRSPRNINRGGCPIGQGCYCCPLAGERWHSNLRSNRTCDRIHPPDETVCSPPYPPKIPECPERATLPAEPPAPPPGHRPLRFAVCVDCGRITARRWSAPSGVVVAWCAGTFPDHAALT